MVPAPNLRPQAVPTEPSTPQTARKTPPPSPYETAALQKLDTGDLLASPIYFPGMAAGRAALAGQMSPPAESLAGKDALDKLRLGDYSGAEPWHARTTALYLAAAGLALLLLAVPLFSGRKAPRTTTRAPMRRVDRLVPGGRVQHFQIVRQLGQGGMGVVFEGFDTHLQRKVALKQLRAEIAANPRERRRFVKEARTVAALKHPHIIEIYSLVDDGESLLLVFEYLDGRTLDAVITERGRLSPKEALAVAGQIGKALDCAHAAGVVHQDLKPANVILSEGCAKVMDFGIARRVQETLSTLSRAEAAGTPAYMAPEQEMGQCDARSDVYALGVCVYEMLAGRRPFEGGLFAQKAAMAFAPLSKANPQVPHAADDVLAEALSPNPALRPESAQAFLSALSRAFSQQLA